MSFKNLITSGSRINDAFFSFKISVKISGFEDDALLPVALSPPEVPVCPSLDASGSASTELKLLSLLLPPVAPAPGDSSKPSAGLLLKLPSVPMVSCTEWPLAALVFVAAAGECFVFCFLVFGVGGGGATAAEGETTTGQVMDCGGIFELLGVHFPGSCSRRFFTCRLSFSLILLSARGSERSSGCILVNFHDRFHAKKSNYIGSCSKSKTNRVVQNCWEKKHSNIVLSNADSCQTAENGQSNFAVRVRRLCFSLLRSWKDFGVNFFRILHPFGHLEGCGNQLRNDDGTRSDAGDAGPAHGNIKKWWVEIFSIRADWSSMFVFARGVAREGKLKNLVRNVSVNYVSWILGTLNIFLRDNLVYSNII